MKPLLLVMTQQREQHISEMVRNIYPIFDGIVGLVNQPSNDNTQKILEQNKGNGRILTREFVPNHAFLMNELLFCRHIKPGQYCVYLDSPEEMKQDFLDLLPNLIDKFEKEKIGALYWDNRPYIFKYSEYMEFIGNYHWGLSGIEGEIITLPDKDRYIINKRKNNPEISWCLNPIKSFVCYPLSNETTIMYSKYGNNILNQMERERRKFRSYLQEVLKLNLNTLGGLIDYMTKIKNKEIIPDEYFINYCENEHRLSELFQLKVLNMDFMGEIVPKRYQFSFSDYLKGGSGFPKNYEGFILRLNKQFNIKS